MWTCSKCREKVEDSYVICWSCNTPRSETNADDTADRPRTAQRSIDQLVFVGLNGYALALDRDSGEIVWSNNNLKSGYVTLLLDGDRLIVSTNGYIFCLDPLTGKTLWNNPLRGYGSGAPTALLSVRGQSSHTVIQQAAAATARAAASSSAASTGS